jgi:hypothetical protein
MFVDTLLLGSKVAVSADLGGHAQGADHLSRGPVRGASPFGDVAATEAFHDAASQAHAHHRTTLQAHHEALSGVGDNAPTTATGFPEIEIDNAAAMRAVRCYNSGT